MITQAGQQNRTMIDGANAPSFDARERAHATLDAIAISKTKFDHEYSVNRHKDAQTLMTMDERDALTLAAKRHNHESVRVPLTLLIADLIEGEYFTETEESIGARRYSVGHSAGALAVAIDAEALYVFTEAASREIALADEGQVLNDTAHWLGLQSDIERHFEFAADRE